MEAVLNFNIRGNVFVEIEKLVGVFDQLNDSIAKIGEVSKSSFGILNEAVKNISLKPLAEDLSEVAQEFENLDNLTSKPLNSVDSDNVNTFIALAKAQNEFTEEQKKFRSVQLQTNMVVKTVTDNLWKMQNAFQSIKSSAADAARSTATSFSQPFIDVVYRFNSIRKAIETVQSVMSTLFRVVNSGASSFSKLTAASGTAGGAMSSLGAAMKGGGWSIAISGAVMLAEKLWDVASGAAAARDKMEKAAKVRDKGDKSSNKNITVIGEETQDKLDQIQYKENRHELGYIEADEERLKIYREKYHKLLAIQKIVKDERQQLRDDYAINKTVNERANSSEFSSIFYHQYTDEQKDIARRYDKFLGSPASLTQQYSDIQEKNTEIANYHTELKGLRRIIESLDSEIDGAKDDRAKIEEDKKKSLINQSSLKTFSSINKQSIFTTDNEDLISNYEKRSMSITIDKLVENLTVQTTTLKEGATDIKKAVTEVLIGAVRDFETAY
jgi:hypothetical protein